MYRQAGFPAFLGLNAGGAAGNTAAGVAAPGGGPNSTSAATSPHVSTSGSTASPYCNIGLQSHANNPNCKFYSLSLLYLNMYFEKKLYFAVGGKLDMMRVRATDPRPCPKCGKVYRSAHTLRTHMEDKHTVCPGYRCVLCGTVAKSRNSLHSHMSRQHRGISTKDLPVLPMPAPFDAELASK